MRLRPETLNRYVQVARPILIEVARQGKTIKYKELQEQQVSPGRGYIGEVVGRISEIELEAKPKRPKLSAVVVRSDTGEVGGGFFGLPDTPQAIRRSTPEEWQNPHLSEADHQYWQSQLREVYRCWRAHAL